MNKEVEFRPQSFSIKPLPNKNGKFSLRGNKQKFEVTNMSLHGYELYLGNTKGVYNIEAIPINEFECMVCDSRISPYYFEIK